ncbi:hypothetical protein AvCA_11710 [Azotobacter vinelandii CA]|uniref:Uncharacterized protein n=2 Tax=Azotobacter vinelandii TaxID=354 RepID=C1DPG8_AZOVD|nr:hypothetical protein [Azotobacter vinelandii]ACO77400.1 hypothetical protein Avin_11710 [Azotobacter vinelandii DJ]AGK15387.1 hypothetical protein AvCA_11710 [Azotobacter vinelandii CA]AGK19777.1 hypothetical protein AvCA6_11710 [Azotobacter vinelandii CA6]
MAIFDEKSCFYEKYPFPYGDVAAFAPGAKQELPTGEQVSSRRFAEPWTGVAVSFCFH